eukprot:IDg22930t1
MLRIQFRGDQSDTDDCGDAEGLLRVNDKNEEVKEKVDRMVVRSSDLESSLHSIYVKLAPKVKSLPRAYCELIKRQVDGVLKKVEEVNSDLSSLTTGDSPGSSRILCIVH